MKHLDALLDDYANLPGDDSRRAALRDMVITEFLPLARNVASSFAHRGVDVDDLTQVATLGLIKAVDRYDPAYGSSLLRYAMPTIRGEIRRYFRDHTWPMRVPRRLKDLSNAVYRASATLAGELNRAPRPSEIADRLDVPVEDVLEALKAGEVYVGCSLDMPLPSDDGASSSLGDLLGAADDNLELVEYRHALAPLLAELDERERTVLMLRFFANKNQTQIGQIIGVSQMHVSRLLNRSLTRLREQLLAAE